LCKYYIFSYNNFITIVNLLLYVYDFEGVFNLWNHYLSAGYI